MGGEDEAEPDAQASDEDAEMPSQPSPSHRPPAKATKRRAGQAARANAPSPEGPASAGAERSERRASKSAPTRSGRAPRTPQFADAVQLQCLAGHTLLRGLTHQRLACDAYGRQVEAGERLLGCSNPACDYDRCSTCAL